jgi:hypothetical protein
MLNGVPGHWLRKSKEASFTLKNVFLKFLKGDYTSSKTFIHFLVP